GAVMVVDWQMVMVAPVAVEFGWFLVSNVGALPFSAEDVLGRYHVALYLMVERYVDGYDADSRPYPAASATPAWPYENWRRQTDLAILVGLLLRGWRKGYDAEAGITLASGVSAVDDLAWWCDRAVEAAARIL